MDIFDGTKYISWCLIHNEPLDERYCSYFWGQVQERSDNQYCIGGGLYIDENWITDSTDMDFI